MLGLSSGVISISAGGDFSCASLSNGSAKCWGAGGKGRLGNGDTTDQSSPVDVVGLPQGASVIDAGEFHACAITNTGLAKCWGTNDYGQVGDGSMSHKAVATDVKR